MDKVRLRAILLGILSRCDEKIESFDGRACDDHGDLPGFVCDLADSIEEALEVIE